MNPGILYMVATPIGNLGDITERAINILKNVDLLLCEDTRVTQKLLNRFDIKVTTKRFDQHSTAAEIPKVLEMLLAGNNIALVTDAGTPGISDPGNQLVEAAAKKGIRIEPIPGASAVPAALSVSGFPTDKFVFMGFPPVKNKRKKYFQELAVSPYTVCLFESCHRIDKTLHELHEHLPGDRRVCVCRELTKKFETIYRGTIEEIIAMDIRAKGEFVIVVSK